jgi:phosphatidylglycerophosphatase A
LKPNKFEIFLGTGFFSGYSPIIPGTAGSFVALIIYLIPGFENPTIMLVFISLATVIGIPLGTKFEHAYGKDPSKFVLDEFVGTWLALITLPKTLIIVVLSFILWRLLDILKPFPARQLERINGGWGIMLDDIISGIYTLILMLVLLQLNIF